MSTLVRVFSTITGRAVVSVVRFPTLLDLEWADVWELTFVAFKFLGSWATKSTYDPNSREPAERSREASRNTMMFARWCPNYRSDVLLGFLPAHSSSFQMVAGSI